MFFRKSRNKVGHTAFTIDEGKIVSEIITECRVSLPYHPRKDGGKKPPPIKKVRALWDTGATNCCITKKLADELGLVGVGKANVGHAKGEELSDVFIVNIILPNEIVFPYVAVTECVAVAGSFDIIIGMDLITKGDLAITNQNGSTTVSFRMPSLTTIDFNDEVDPPIPTPKNTSEPKSNGTKDDPYPGTSLNAPCPCGKGKKYKRCHGINASR